MLDHHASDRLNGNDSGFVGRRRLNLDTNGINASAGMLHGNALEVDALHFALSPRIIEGQTDKTLHIGNGVLVVGVGTRGSCLAHHSRIGETNHAWIETVGVAIEDDVHATAAGGGDDRVLVAKVDPYYAHGC
mmetsp:Transcript_20869/g.45517  ORF Transcript_20869/g.45517 Transcript_20869/m.45517 type:complete len:133 (+) Transcript_20869:2254-2652(+)